MNARPLLLWLLLLPVAPVLADDADKQQPVNLRADRIEIDQKSGVSHYRGHVQLTQGTLRLTADHASARVRLGQTIDTITAEGNPLTFRQRPQGQQTFVEGTAARGEYEANQQKLHLYGAADIRRGDDRFRGGVIHYNMQDRTLHAESDATARVYAVLAPRRPATPGDQAP
jgi:lipopolysaccharide export system protein LptA